MRLISRGCWKLHRRDTDFFSAEFTSTRYLHKLIFSSLHIFDTHVCTYSHHVYVKSFLILYNRYHV